MYDSQKECEYGRKMIDRSQVFEEHQHDRIWGFPIENVLSLKFLHKVVICLELFQSNISSKNISKNDCRADL